MSRTIIKHVTAVSYTHLDVYKRQVLYLAAETKLLKKRLEGFYKEKIPMILLKLLKIQF